MYCFFTTVFTCTAQEYFQQDVNQKINVTLDDSLNFLLGDTEIDYQNNSPDTLKEIFFHLWPNAYKTNATALGEQLKQ